MKVSKTILGKTSNLSTKMRGLGILAVVFLMTSCISYNTVSSPAPMSQDVLNQHDKNTNFVKANEWMVTQFNNAESVIQFSDKEAGLVKGKYMMKAGFYQAPSKYSPEVSTDPTYAVITLRVRDNKSRIEIALASETYSEVVYGGKTITPSPQELSIRGNELMADFANHMKNESENNNW